MTDREAVKWADHLKFSPEWEDYLTLVAELALLIAECEQAAEEACCRRMCVHRGNGLEA